MCASSWVRVLVFYCFAKCFFKLLWFILFAVFSIFRKMTESDSEGEGVGGGLGDDAAITIDDTDSHQEESNSTNQEESNSNLKLTPGDVKLKLANGEYKVSHSLFVH